MQTFFKFFQEKVCRGRLSTKFDTSSEPADVKLFKKLIFCQQTIAQNVTDTFSGCARHLLRMRQTPSQDAPDAFAGIDSPF